MYKDYFDDDELEFGKPKEPYSDIKFYLELWGYLSLLQALIGFGADIRSKYWITTANKYLESSFVENLTNYTSLLTAVDKYSHRFGFSLKNLCKEYQVK